MTDQQVNRTTDQKKHLTPFPLKNYAFYKQEKYYNDQLEPMYKGPLEKIGDNLNVRYEMQIMLIEQNNENEKQVIYFSCYPPYLYEGQNIYNYEFYNNFNVFNIHAVNFIMFGIFDEVAGTIVFKKGNDDSIWYTSYDLKEKQYKITDIEFCYRSKLVKKSTSEILKNVPTYKEMNAPEIVLQQDITEPIGPSSDKVKDHILYHDNSNNEFYIEFTEALDDKNHTWIRFGSDRIKGK